MKPEEFITAYESALATQNWNNIAPLVAKEASVTFSDGTLHTGIDKIRVAYQRNFAIIKSEKYSITQVNWIIKTASFAAYTFKFSWTGIINNKLVSGNGIGTTTIIHEENGWKLLTEHLGKKVA